MNWLSSALTSSVGRKWVMGLTGFFLIGFSLVHLAGNLLLYVGDGAYNHYAHSLHANPNLVLVAEIILLILFATHILLSFQLTIANRRARPEAYEMRRSKQGNTKAAPSATMYITGALVLGFILLHLADFRFHLHNPGPEGEEPFVKALRLMQDPITASVYFLGSLLLGWHLWHGFQSAFQSLGLRNPKYTPIIYKVGIALTLLLGLGFASFPVWAFMKKFGVLP